MMETLKMWVFGLPYALWETQRIKVAVDRIVFLVNLETGPGSIKAFREMERRDALEEYGLDWN